jgi:hypothetical protein
MGSGQLEQLNVLEGDQENVVAPEALSWTDDPASMVVLDGDVDKLRDPVVPTE